MRRGHPKDERSASSTNAKLECQPVQQSPLSIRRSPEIDLRAEISKMSKIIGAAKAITVVVVAILAWSKFAAIKPEAAAATKAAARDGGPIISPFETIIKHGENLPVEDWRPVN
jgi:hypothetical protein